MTPIYVLVWEMPETESSGQNNKREMYVGHLDRELNDDAHICPSLGDARDRIFGTK